MDDYKDYTLEIVIDFYNKEIKYQVFNNIDLVTLKREIFDDIVFHNYTLNELWITYYLNDKLYHKENIVEFDWFLSHRFEDLIDYLIQNKKPNGD